MMNSRRERIRERLANLGVKGGDPHPRRTAEAIALEAYHSSRIEGCRVEYPRLVVARSRKADDKQP